MDKSLEPILTGLIPSLTGPLDPRLLELAASLLASSRNRISALKPQEEVARGYVCAHIACDRLKTVLDLPEIEPRPPLPKKNYAALYSQFQNALRNTVSTANPSRRGKVAKAKPDAATGEVEAELPEDVKVSIIEMCSLLKATNAAEFIIAGATAVLKSPTGAPARTGRQGPARKRKLYSLLAAVSLLVIEKLLSFTPAITKKGGTAAGWVRGSGYETKRNAVMEGLGEDGKGVTGEMVDGWVKELSKQGMAGWSWLSDVPDAVGLMGSVEGGKKRKAEEWTGVGAMRQAGVDYLSKRNVRARDEWIERVLLKVEAMEKGVV
ncbi:hypothetical protein RUND412_002484 [Rhizina undulata]